MVAHFSRCSFLDTASSDSYSTLNCSAGLQNLLVMSAYALPGFFPPLPFEHLNSDIVTSVSCSPFSAEYTDKVDHQVTLTRDTIGKCPRPCSEIEIVIKDAKIDSLQLIQSLTINSGASSLPRRARRRKSPTSAAEHPADMDAAFLQELAMLFELEVSHNGRRYTLVRSFYRIRQLREELLLETSTLYGDHERSSSLKSASTIPELPTLQEENSTIKSFSMLHDLLRSHAPGMEIWLRKIVSLVSPTSSPAFATFLLEPICFLHSGNIEQSMISLNGNTAASRQFDRKVSLESIEEMYEEHCED